MALLVIRIDTGELAAGLRRRAPGIALALAIELLLALLLLTMVPNMVRKEPVPMSVFGIEAEAPPAAEEAPTEAAAEPPREAARSEAPPVSEPEPAPPAAARAETPDLSAPSAAQSPFLLMSPDAMAAGDIARATPPAPRRAAPARTMGPVDPGARPGYGDTPRVAGTGPNGEPLYAASWYREPYDEELSGYLSTARGPGWGMIICRTVPDYRVRDCEMVDEYPAGSGIARSVLAAAWQFRVRPPRVGGRLKYGEWVRIRIDYGIDRIDYR